MEKPLISVITPVYNTADYLPRTIESILAQTHEAIEVLLINDGSTDDSGKICDRYAQRDNRIKVLHQNNAGVSAARNAGLNIAKGEWIGFVDSDDWIEPNMYEKLLASAIKNKKNISICGFIKHHLDGWMEKRTFENLPHIVSANDALEHVVSGQYYEGFSVNKLFFKNLFEVGNKLQFNQNFHFCEDLVLVVQLILKASEGIACVSDALYHYCVREGNAISTFGQHRLSEIPARKYVVELVNHNEIAKVQYVQSIIGMLYRAAQFGKTEYFPMLKKEARIYCKIYFSSPNVSFKQKLRSTLILISPRISFALWIFIKRNLGVTWWGTEIGN